MESDNLRREATRPDEQVLPSSEFANIANGSKADTNPKANSTDEYSEHEILTYAQSPPEYELERDITFYRRARLVCYIISTLCLLVLGTSLTSVISLVEAPLLVRVVVIVMLIVVGLLAVSAILGVRFAHGELQRARATLAEMRGNTTLDEEPENASKHTEAGIEPSARPESHSLSTQTGEMPETTEEADAKGTDAEATKINDSGSDKPSDNEKPS